MSRPFQFKLSLVLEVVSWTWKQTVDKLRIGYRRGLQASMSEAGT
jgi:hypothetical protein